MNDRELPRLATLLTLILGACAGGTDPGPPPVTRNYVPRPVDMRTAPPEVPTQPQDFKTPPQLQPQIEVGAIPARPAPPLSGGTLLVLRDGKTAVASDPDGDALFVVDLTEGVVLARVALGEGDLPGRLAEDANGGVHVVLRQGGAIASLTQGRWTIAQRRAVCPAPRGLAYQASGDALIVACAGGELVSLPAHSGPPTRQLMLEPDLRDVVIGEDAVYVSTFRRAELLVLDGDGRIVDRRGPPPSLNLTRRSVAAPSQTRFEPAVAWRTVARPGGGVLMLHQRAFTGDLVADTGGASGGYGGGECGGVVQTTVTDIGPGGPVSVASEISGALLAVDLASSNDGKRLALVSPANAHVPGVGSIVITGPTSGFVAGSSFGCLSVASDLLGPQSGVVATVEANWTDQSEYAFAHHLFSEAVAVAFDGQGDVVVQTRAPAELRVPRRQLRVGLATAAVSDPGYALFHSNSGAGIACASCHPEGGEDGRVWHFAGQGPRRTQSLRGGLTATAPLHWEGDMRDLDQIMQDVFTGRMGGPALNPEQKTAFARWLDALPLVPPSPADANAVERGRAAWARLECASCHSGARFTSNLSADVGTGRPYQVPSLTGLAARAPYMHDGCAPTLIARFTPACGGMAHGKVASADELPDLIAFLQSL